MCDAGESPALLGAGGYRAPRKGMAGVPLDDLRRAEDAPPTLFDAAVSRSGALMAAMDRVNAKFGRGTLFPAAVGIERDWKQQAAHHSPRYTTQLDELPRVQA